MLTKWSLDSVLPSQASAHVASDQEGQAPTCPASNLDVARIPISDVIEGVFKELNLREKTKHCVLNFTPLHTTCGGLRF